MSIPDWITAAATAITGVIASAAAYQNVLDRRRAKLPTVKSRIWGEPATPMNAAKLRINLVIENQLRESLRVDAVKLLYPWWVSTKINLPPNLKPRESGAFAIEIYPRRAWPGACILIMLRVTSSAKTLRRSCVLVFRPRIRWPPRVPQGAKWETHPDDVD